MPWGGTSSSSGSSRDSGPSASEKYPRGPKTRLAQNIYQRLNSSDKEQRQRGLEILRDNYSALTPRLREEFGFEEIYKALPPKEKKAKGFGAFLAGAQRNTFGKPVFKALELAQRPQQAIGEGIQQVIHDSGITDIYSDRTKEFKGSGGGYGDIVRALQGKERTNLSGEKIRAQGFMDVVGATPNKEHWNDLNFIEKMPYRVAGFTGDVLMDPLKGAGKGSKAAAETARSAATKEVAQDIAENGYENIAPKLAKRLGYKNIEDLSDEEIQQALLRTGKKALTKDQYRRVAQRVTEEAPEARMTRGVFGVGKRVVPLKGDAGWQGFRDRTLLGLGKREGAEKVGQDAVSALKHWDRGGLNYMGKSLVPAPVRDLLRTPLKGDKVFTTNAERAAAVVDSAIPQADRVAGAAARAEETANVAAGKAQNLVTKHQRIPFSKIEDRIIDGKNALRDLKDNLPTGAIRPGDVPEDVRLALSKMSLKLEQEVSKLHGPTGLAPLAADAPEAAALSERAARVKALLADEDYEGLLAELDKITPAARKVGDVTENDLPFVSRAAADVQKEVRGTVAGLRAEQEQARKAALRAIRNTEKEVAKAEELKAALGGAEGVKVPRKVASALKAQEERAAAAAEKARVLRAKEQELRDAINAGDTGALLEADPGLGASIPYRKDVPSLAGRLPGAQSAKDYFKEGFRTRRGFEGARVGEGARDAQYAISEREIGPRVVDTEHLIRTISDLHKSVPGGLFTEENQRILLRAAEQKGGFKEIAGHLRDMGKPELARAAEVLDKIRRSDARALVRERLFRPEDLLDADTYLAHRFTDEGNKAIQEALASPQAERVFGKNASRLINKTKQTGEQGGAYKARVLTRGLTISEAEADLAAKLQAAGVKVPEGGIMISDPVTLIAKRHEEIQNAVTQARIFTKMEDGIKAADGGKLIGFVPRGLSDAEQARLGEAYARRGLAEVNAGGNNKVFVHPDLVDEVTNIKRVLSDDKAIAALEKSLAYVTKMWKSYATVFPGKGLGFPMRNAESNVMLNSLAGVINPLEYMDAAKMMQEARKASKAFPDLSVPEAMLKNGVDAGRVAEYEAALETRSIKTGFFDVDMAADPMAEVQAAHASRGARALRGANPLTTNFAPLRAGTKIQGAIEDHARLTHFLSNLRSGMSIDDAAASVKKWLFDYGDLTNLERRLFKNVLPFYTFTRKNTPLVLSVFAKDPAKINRLMFFQQNLLGDGKQQDGQRIPEYLQTSGTLLPKDISGALTGDYSNPVIGGLDTPIDAAAKGIDPIFKILGATPGVQNVLPKDMQKQTAGDIVGSFFNMTGGPIPEAIKFGVGERTGVDMFTGAPIKDKDENRRVGIGLKIAQIFNPAITPTLRLYGVESVFGQKTGSKVSDTARQRFIESLTGVQSTRVTDQMSYKQFTYEVAKLKEDIIALREAGVDVPTMQELRDADIVPDYRSSRRSSGKRGWNG